MHMTRRAPELSATSKLVCIWIMVLYLPERLAGGLGGFGQNLPSLQLGFRRALDDPSDFAGLVVIGFVMGVETLGTTHGLLQHRMQEGPFDPHDHGLVALVGNDDALKNSLWHDLSSGRRGLA